MDSRKLVAFQGACDPRVIQPFRIKRLAIGVDLEEFQPRFGKAGRRCSQLSKLMETLLELLARYSAKATFFTVGETAEQFPELIRSLSTQGHEIASHGHHHTPISKLDPISFTDDLRRSMDTLNGLSENPVIGFRAPLLSLTKDCAWAYDRLKAEGIKYSSSVFPAANVQYGWPGCPTVPHERGGIYEYPITLIRIAWRHFPAVGGAYFRIVPQEWMFKALGKLRDEPLITSYFHPYDFDCEQTFAIHRELARKPWLAPLLFYNRPEFLKRLEVLLDHTESLLTFSQHYEEMSQS